MKLLGRDVKVAEQQLNEAVEHHKKAQKEGKIQIVEEVPTDVVSVEHLDDAPEEPKKKEKGKAAKGKPPVAAKASKSARREKSA